MVELRHNKEWWLKRASLEPDCPITAGVPNERDALWTCQQYAAIGIEETDDTGPLADLFAAIHRTAASALASSKPPVNEAGESVAQGMEARQGEDANAASSRSDDSPVLRQEDAPND